MKNFRRLLVAVLLTAVFAVPAWAGEVHTPGAPNPGDGHSPGSSVMGEIHTPGIAGEIETPGLTAPGDIDTPGSVADIAGTPKLTLGA